jgi:CBS domain-containing protein
MRQNVEDIMQRTVVTVTPETPVRELLRRLVNEQISGVPVVTPEGDIVGVVSTTDVVRLGAEEGEIPQGDLTLGFLGRTADDFDEDSAAHFFTVSEEWKYPTDDETRTIPERIFDGFTVADIMTSAAFTVGPKDTVETVAKFLLQGRIHRALVVEDDQLKGIVTAFDLLKAFVGE